MTIGKDFHDRAADHDAGLGVKEHREHHSLYSEQRFAEQAKLAAKVFGSLETV